MKSSIYVNDSYVNTKSESRMYLRVYLNKKYVKIPLNIYINADDFDKDKQRVTKGKSKHTYNKIIEDSLGRVAGIALKYQVNKMKLTAAKLKKEFDALDNPGDVYEFLKEELLITKAKHKENTHKNHEYQLNKVKRYRKSLVFEELDEDYINGLINYLKYKEHNKNNTVNATLTIYRRYLNIAVRKGYLSSSPFEVTPIAKRGNTTPFFLSEDEVNHLKNIYKRNELSGTKQKSLRYFLFGTQTGMRIGDIRFATHENIRNNILRYIPAKTDESSGIEVKVPLTKFAKQLIKDENKFRIRGLLFDCKSYSNMYQRLVEVIKYAKLPKDVGFHTARHTFATMFLRKSKNANGLIILQKLLGHSKIETTMIYSHVITDDIVKAMGEFDS